jgi:hypothetical protein
VFALLGLVATATACAAPFPPTADDDETPARVEVGKIRVEDVPRGWRVERRLIQDGTMIATQTTTPYLMPHDAPNVLGVFTPWDVLLVEGAITVFDPRHEPLSYFHRSGPVGAVFRELRTRKDGADAAAPVGVVGLNAGTVAAYALPGERVTFYETDPALKGLVADTDKHFTFVADARRRGAVIDVRAGDARKALARDADRRYAVLLVELFDTGFDPGDRLTLEAVRLYVDRVAPDGIVALHVSNKEFRLEPVVARIAQELGLVGRIWSDNFDAQPGKTASTWVALARDRKALGGLDSPIGNLAAKSPEHAQLRHVLAAASGREKAREWELAADQKAAALAWLKGRADPESALLAGLVERYGLYAKLGDVMVVEVGHAFRPLNLDEGIGVRRDGDKEWPAAARWPKKK